MYTGQKLPDLLILKCFALIIESRFYLYLARGYCILINKYIEKKKKKEDIAYLSINILKKKKKEGIAYLAWQHDRSNEFTARSAIKRILRSHTVH